MTESTHDVVIVGGGHNGLTAAAYLAKSGRSVILLERSDQVGGAAISAEAFEGVDARLSRYSYLVSLLPQRIIDELRLNIRLVRRRYSSYTPNPADAASGLLIDHADAAATLASFDRVGATADAEAWTAFYAMTHAVAGALFPTVCEPLPTRSEAKRLVGSVAGDAAWTDLFERPLGATLRDRFESDLVRGVVATDGLIGTFTSADDVSLAANRCLLYHVIGNGTGDWDVPVGGMGAVTGELERVARQAGARIVTGATVTSVSPSGAVRYQRRGSERSVVGGRVLVNAAPWVLAGLLAAGGGEPVGSEQVESEQVGSRQVKPEGAQVKVNLLLTRLPKLRDPEVSPEAAFGGTFHSNENFSQLEAAYDQGLRGVVPALLPCEVYSHSLSDPSILSPDLALAGVHTLTVFGLQTPSRWLAPENNEATRARLQEAVLASLNSMLADPIENLLLTDAAGRPCIETKTALDLERDLNMPGGNIFHGELAWPFLEDDAPRTTAAERWGVATAHPRILLCGAGARRGGGVSGIGGHNAAMAVLEGD